MIFAKRLLTAKQKVGLFILETLIIITLYLCVMWAIYGIEEIERYFGLEMLLLFSKFAFWALVAHSFINLDKKYGKKTSCK